MAVSSFDFSLHVLSKCYTFFLPNSIISVSLIVFLFLFIEAAKQYSVLQYRFTRFMRYPVIVNKTLSSFQDRSNDRYAGGRNKLWNDTVTRAWQWSNDAFGVSKVQIKIGKKIAFIILLSSICFLIPFGIPLLRQFVTTRLFPLRKKPRMQIRRNSS